MKKIFLLIFLFITKITIAQVPEPQKNTYVNDFAHVLTADQAAVLNQGIFAIEKKSGVQLAIVLVDKVPAQYDMEEFALLIGRKWHVGKNEDGIVYVAAIQQRKQRFEIARRLDNTFSNEKSQSILAAIKPYFKQKDYNGGLQELINQVDIAVSANIKNADTTQNAATAATAATTGQTNPDSDPDGTLDFWIGLAAVVMVIVLIIYFIRRSRRNRMNNFNNGPGGFNNDPMYNPGGGSGYSGIGGFVAGAALGAAAGYVASELADNLNNNQVPQQPDNIPADDFSNSDNDNSSQDDNNSSNWGNWGSDSSDDSSSDSGFSGGDFSSDGGGGSDW